MGFLNFRRKTKTNKALTPPPVVTTDLKNDTTDTGSNYHSPIANSFMMVGSSISDIAQSSLSEDIFNELIPLSPKNNSSTKSRDIIRYSLSLKPSSNNITTTSNLPLKINTTIDSNSNSVDDSVKAQLNESILSSSTRSSKQSDSSGSSLTSLSSIEEFVPLHPVSRSDPQNYLVNSSKKMSENVPLIDSLHRSPHEQQQSINTDTATITIPGLAIARMKERHRQEYRRSMQWSPALPSSSTPLVNHRKKKTNSFNNQRIHPMQLSSTPVNNRVQMPLINQIKPVIPTRSTSVNMFTSNPFNKRPLITSIPHTNQPVDYQQTRPVVATMAVVDNRSFYNDNNNQQYTKPMHYQVEKMNSNQSRYSRQRLVGITEYQHQQQHQQLHYISNNIEVSKPSKLKIDYRHTVYAKKYDSVPNFVGLLEDGGYQQQEKRVSTHCSHHQPHRTLTKRQYNSSCNNNSCCQQKQHHQIIRCHHYNHPNHHHKKPVICYNSSKCCQT